MTAQVIDVHEELADAKVGGFPLASRRHHGVADTVRRLRHLQSGLRHPLCRGAVGPQGRAGRPADIQRAGRLPDRRRPARRGGRQVRAPRHAAGRALDHQRLHAADRGAGELVHLVLRVAAAHRPWSRRAAAAGDHLHQRTGAAAGRQHLRAVGRRFGLGGRRHDGRRRRRVRHADAWAGTACTGSDRSRSCCCRSCM